MKIKPALTSIVVLALILAAFFAGRDSGRKAPQTLETDRGAIEKGVAAKFPRKPTPTAARNSSLSSTATTSAPLPPPGTPLKESFADLQVRATSGDAAAASRLYQDLQHCRHYRQVTSLMPMQTTFALNGGPPPKDMPQKMWLEIQSQQLDEVEKWQSFLRDNESLCAGMDQQQIESVLPATLQAALLGDQAAADCYVSSTLQWPEGLINHPEWLDDYRSNALQLAQKGFERGNWDIVNQLALAYSPATQGLLPLGQLTGTDPLRAYRYAKLQALGRPPTSANNPFMDQPLLTAAKGLTDEQRNEADAWAQDAYRRYFGGVPQSATMDGCGIGEGN